jgi:excisionase family DNA binding protein
METTADTRSGLLTLVAAGHRLGIGLTSVKRLVYSGQLASMRVGARLVRVHPDDLDDYIFRERKRASESRKRLGMLGDAEVSDASADNSAAYRGGGAPRDRVAALRGRIGGLSTHASHDSREVTRSARDAFLARFLIQVDPDCELPEAERIRRADCAKRAHMAELSLRSAQARRRR